MGYGHRIQGISSVVFGSQNDKSDGRAVIPTKPHCPCGSGQRAFGPARQHCEAFIFEKTQVPLKTVPLLDGLLSSSAERLKERRFQDTASPRTPNQWHITIKAEEICFKALPARVVIH